MLRYDLINKYKNKLLIAKANAKKFSDQGKMVLFGEAQVNVILLTEFLDDLLNLTFPDPNA